MTAINTQEPTTVEKMRGLRQVAAAILLLTPGYYPNLACRPQRLCGGCSVLLLQSGTLLGGYYRVMVGVGWLIDMATSRWHLRVSA